MINLQKVWVRVVISLFTGGLISEIIYISTGDPNRPESKYSSLLLIILSFIIYLVFTSILKKIGKIK